jgi:hypothetical protein
MTVCDKFSIEVVDGNLVRCESVSELYLQKAMDALFKHISRTYDVKNDWMEFNFKFKQNDEGFIFTNPTCFVCPSPEE